MRFSVRSVWDFALDIVFPPALDPQGRVEANPWLNVQFIDAPCCAACGLPFDYFAGAHVLCGGCAANRPAYDQARAAIIYNDGSRGLILAFKHGGRTENLDVFAAQLRRAGRQFWTEADVLVPVPLHNRRLVLRRYNQAALLAASLSKQISIPMDAGMLLRHRATGSQGEQTARGRFRNVQGAFSVPEKKRADCQGKTIVLVDDVMTTGATLQACARTLRRAGASRINVVTLARTVRQGEL